MRLSLLILFFLLYNLFTCWAETPDEVDSTQEAHRLNEAASLLSEYIKFESLSAKEAPAGKFLAEFCRQKGLFINYFRTDALGDQLNFSASLYPLSVDKPNIVLLNHIDVVHASDSSWTFPPFSGTIAEGAVWGRGAIDCKGLAIMQLFAILEFQEESIIRELPYNVTMLCVSDEETGGSFGTKVIVDEYLDILNPVVVLGEGGAGLKNVLTSRPDTDVYGISIAEKSNLWLKLELKQKSFGHGATPSHNYANRLMIDALNKLNYEKVRLKFNRSSRLMFKEMGKAEGGIRGFFISNLNWVVLSPFVRGYVKKDPLFKSLMTNTVTITNLFNPPGPPNIISSFSTAYLDCRLLPGTGKKAFIRHIKRIIDEPKIKVTVINESPESEATKPDMFFEVLKASILQYNPKAVVLPILFPATSDNNYFREKGIPVYGLIPAVLEKELIESIHNSNERITFEALSSGIVIYENFLTNLLKEKTVLNAGLSN